MQANKPAPPQTTKPDDRGANVERQKKENPSNPFHFTPDKKRDEPEPRSNEIYEEELPPETRVR